MYLVFWVAFALGAVSWIAFWYWCAGLRTVPLLAPGRADRISVIIPARNERNNLGRLLPSLLNQPDQPHEIIVVDDHSDDGTGDYARELGLRVVDGAELPEGWMGKTWACHQGAEVSSGEWLLFLDADIEVQPDGLGRLAALAGGDDHVHSICPYHRMEKAYEQLSAVFNAIMVVGSNAFTLGRAKGQRIGLFGQSLLVSRKRYQQVGGHGAVKTEILENYALAGHFREQGVECQCWLGRGTLSMRMFPEGRDHLVNSWSKGAAAGASCTPKSVVVGVSLWMTAMSVGLMNLVAALVLGIESWGWAAIFYSLAAAQAGYLFRRVGSYWLLTAACYPVFLGFYLHVFGRASRMKKRGERVQWKGRDVG